MSRRPSICIVSHFAFGALSGRPGGHIGGVERQTTLMARWFAARGYETSLITWDEGQPDGVIIDGVRVLKMCRREDGVPGFRFLDPRWTSLNAALGRAGADLYYQNCAEYVTGQVALWCRWHRRKFIYSVACEPDCDPRLPEMPEWRVRVLYRYGLRHADRVVVQTKAQAAMIRSGFGRESVVLPMPCSGPAEGEDVRPQPPGRAAARVLWVARIARQKRLEALLDVAERMPDLAFDVAGPPDRERERSYTDALLARARALPNVTVHGAVAREDLPALYRRAACLVCTSRIEGFPNTFLEAFSHGLPVVSTFDPDHLIDDRGLGVAAPDTAGVVAGIRALIESPELWRAASVAARRYYLENHTVEAVMSRFERVFLEAGGAGARHRAQPVPA